MKRFFFFLMTVAVSLQAAPPGTWFSEAELPQKYDQLIYPFYEAMPTGMLHGKDGALLSWKKFEVPNERGAIVLVSGYGQSHVQFAELMYGLTKLGYSVYIMDNRGLGFSSRMLRNSYKIWVDCFDDYVDDLKTFVDQVVNATPHRKRIMLGHSMGGQIVSMYQAMHPGEMDAVILNSPLVEMIAGNFAEWQAYAAARAMSLGFQGDEYAFGQHDPDFNALGFDAQTMTHSQARHAIKQKIWQKFPYTKSGGATFGWVYKTINGSYWMRDHAPAAMTMPVLVLQADTDTIVVADQEKWLCDRLPNCKRVQYPNSYHELLWEADEIRNPALAEVEAFLEANTR